MERPTIDECKQFGSRRSSSLRRLESQDNQGSGTPLEESSQVSVSNQVSQNQARFGDPSHRNEIIDRGPTLASNTRGSVFESDDERHVCTLFDKAPGSEMDLYQ